MINGYEWRELINKLGSDFPDGEIKYLMGYKDQPYLPYKLYKNRMDEVVGSANYSFVVDSIIKEDFRRQINIIVRATIILIDDDGNEVCRRSAGGSASVKFASPKDDEDENETMPVKVGNDVRCAVKDAFKECCKMFGVSERQLSELKTQAKNKGEKTARQSLESCIVIIESPFRQVGSGYIADGRMADGSSKQLVIWNSVLTSLTKKYAMDAKSFISSLTKGRKLAFDGRMNIYKGKEQFVIEDVAKDTAAKGA